MYILHVNYTHVCYHEIYHAFKCWSQNIYSILNHTWRWFEFDQNVWKQKKKHTTNTSTLSPLGLNDGCVSGALRRAPATAPPVAVGTGEDPRRLHPTDSTGRKSDGRTVWRSGLVGNDVHLGWSGLVGLVWLVWSRDPFDVVVRPFLRSILKALVFLETRLLRIVHP